MSFTDVDEHLKDHHNETEEETNDIAEDQPLEPIYEYEEEVDGVAIIMHESSSKRLTCEKCRKSYKGMKRFVNHLKTHNAELRDKVDPLEGPPVDKEQFCQQVICDNEPDKICYRCIECGTMFDTKKSFLLHYKIHENGRARDIKNENFPQSSLSCKVCNKSIPNYQHLELHMRAHTEKEVYQSQKNYEYNTDEIRQAPVDSSAKINKLACQYCGKVFKRPVEKVKHERVHSGEKPYSCEVSWVV